MIAALVLGLMFGTEVRFSHEGAPFGAVKQLPSLDVVVSENFFEPNFKIQRQFNITARYFLKIIIHEKEHGMNFIQGRCLCNLQYSVLIRPDKMIVCREGENSALGANSGSDYCSSKNSFTPVIVSQCISNVVGRYNVPRNIFLFRNELYWHYYYKRFVCGAKALLGGLSAFSSGASTYHSSEGLPPGFSTLALPLRPQPIGRVLQGKSEECNENSCYGSDKPIVGIEKVKNSLGDMLAFWIFQAAMWGLLYYAYVDGKGV
jgi:hypothetical protein